MTRLRRGVAVLLLAGTAFVLTACSSLFPTTTTEAGGAAVETPAPAADGGLFGGNWLTIAMVVLLAVLVFFMWRSSRKRKADAQKLQSTMVPGAEVMTSFGLYGTLVSVDELAATAEIEVSPGNIIKVHRQTLVKVVDPSAAVSGDAPRSVEEAMAIADREQAERDAAAADALAEREAAEFSGEAEEPRFGERIKDDGDDEGKGSKNS